MELVELLVVVVMVLVNAVFAAYEIALASLSVSRLQLLVREGTPGAKASLRMKQEIENSLAVVQLGITLVGTAAGATGGASAGDDIAPQLMAWGLPLATANLVAIVLVVVPLTAVTIVIGELVPKLFALRNKEWVCLKLSPIMSWFAASMWPPIWFLENSASGLMNLSERLWRPRPHPDARAESAELQELRAIASLARTTRLIGAREENIILGAARLSSRELHEIMLPAEHISMLNLQDSIAQCLIAAHLDMHTRFPVTSKPHDPQSIVGYVTFKDIVAVLKISPNEPSLTGIVRGIPSLPENLPISTALEQLMREHTHIALVRNPTNWITGLVTLEDILEELIGDIQDEYDLLPTHAVKSGTGWVVGGGISLHRLREITGIDLANDRSDHEVHNLNGWILEHLDQPPTGGEIVTTHGVRALVRKVRRQRVLEASLSQLQ